MVVAGLRRGFLGTRIFKHSDWDKTPHGKALIRRKHTNSFEDDTPDIGAQPEDGVEIVFSAPHTSEVKSNSVGGIPVHSGDNAVENASTQANRDGSLYYPLTIGITEIFLICELYRINRNIYRIRLWDGVVPNTVLLAQMENGNASTDIIFSYSGGSDTEVGVWSDNSWMRFKVYIDTDNDKVRYWYDDADNPNTSGEQTTINNGADSSCIEFFHDSIGGIGGVEIDDVIMYFNAPSGLTNEERFA